MNNEVKDRVHVEVFKDYYHNTVKFVIGKQAFSNEPKHVFVITRYDNKWLLTKHKDRGLEFPGGKIELGETAEQAAIREVKEETGGEVEEIKFIGQYFVAGKSDEIIKNVYFAQVSQLYEQEHYFETEGPVLVEELPNNIKVNKNYSFIMKDNVLTFSLKEIKNKKYI